MRGRDMGSSGSLCREQVGHIWEGVECLPCVCVCLAQRGEGDPRPLLTKPQTLPRWLGQIGSISSRWLGQYAKMTGVMEAARR